LPEQAADLKGQKTPGPDGEEQTHGAIPVEGKRFRRSIRRKARLYAHLLSRDRHCFQFLCGGVYSHKQGSLRLVKRKIGITKKKSRGEMEIVFTRSCLQPNTTPEHLAEVTQPHRRI
jgi:hypothetical protein